MAKRKTIYTYFNSLSKKNKQLLYNYIDYVYLSQVRTGEGKRKNFFVQHNSPEGIKIVQEILKFLRINEKADKK